MDQKTQNNQWWDNFRGRCVSCRHSTPSTRKNEVLCQLQVASVFMGLPSRPGGSFTGQPVHKLYGCVYFQSNEPKN